MRSRDRQWLVGWLAFVVAGAAVLFVLGLLARNGTFSVGSWAIRGGLEFVPWYATVIVLPPLFWLCAWFPITRGRIGRTLLAYVPAGIVGCAFHILLCVPPTAWLVNWGPGAISLAEGTRRMFVMRWPSDLVIFTLLVAACHAVVFARSLQERKLAASRLRAQLAESELRTLRAQLEPHFLFNTLNAIAAHVREEPEIAERMLERLSELLRAVLQTRGDSEVSLARELELVRYYLDIHRVRFGYRLHADVDVEDGTQAALVPALILQPLVENAIRHGFDSGAQTSESARIAIRATRRDGMLELRVEDEGRGPFLGPQDAANGEGIGLSNTRRRLAQLYGARQRLDVRPGAERGTTVEVALPFHT
jgi:two-component sensor histidine kinase